MRALPPGSQDALRTLYLLDALDEDGHVTALGRTMSRLPLEPGLARCLLAAQELRCARRPLELHGAQAVVSAWEQRCAEESASLSQGT